MMKTKLLLTTGTLGVALSLVIVGCGNTVAHVPNGNPSHNTSTTKVTPTPKASPTPNNNVGNPNSTPLPTVTGNPIVTAGIINAFNPKAIISPLDTYSGNVTVVSVTKVTFGYNVVLKGQFYSTKTLACQAPALPSVNGQPSKYGPVPKTVTIDVFSTTTLYINSSPPYYVSSEATNPTGTTITYNCQ